MAEMRLVKRPIGADSIVDTSGTVARRMGISTDLVDTHSYDGRRETTGV